jgi:hypothetical protein
VAWSSELEALIIKLWNDGASSRKICDEVRQLDPSRTDLQIKSKVQRLRVQGKLVSRYKSHKNKKGALLKKPPVTSGMPKDKSVDKHAEHILPEPGNKPGPEPGKVELPSEEIPAWAQRPVCPGPEHDSLQSLLTEIRDLLRKPEPETFSFDYHCRSCRSGGSCYDEEVVWRVCPRCGESLIVWNVKVSES